MVPETNLVKLSKENQSTEINITVRAAFDKFSYILKMKTAHIVSRSESVPVFTVFIAMDISEKQIKHRQSNKSSNNN